MAINPMADADAEAPKPSKLAKAASIFDIVGNIGGLGLKGMDMYKMSSAGKAAKAGEEFAKGGSNLSGTGPGKYDLFGGKWDK